MVNGQFFSGSTVDTLVSIPSLDVVPPHSFSITAAEGEEILHEASGSFHWLIEGLLRFVLGLTSTAITAAVG